MDRVKKNGGRSANTRSISRPAERLSVSWIALTYSEYVSVLLVPLMPKIVYICLVNLLRCCNSGRGAPGNAAGATVCRRRSICGRPWPVSKGGLRPTAWRVRSRRGWTTWDNERYFFIWIETLCNLIKFDLTFLSSPNNFILLILGCTYDWIIWILQRVLPPTPQKIVFLLFFPTYFTLNSSP